MWGDLNPALIFVKSIFFRQIVAVLFLLASFCSSAEALHIKCNYTIQRTIDAYGPPVIVLLTNVYSCKGTIWTICDNSLKCLGVSNDHLPGRYNAHVSYLEIPLYSFGPRMPTSIEQFFPNLEGLQIKYGSLETISSDDIRYPKLKVLHIRNNKLKSLEKGLFIHTPNLIFVGVESNHIARVAYDLFEPLKMLHTIYIFKNPCKIGYWVDIVEMKRQINYQCGCKTYKVTKRNMQQEVSLADVSKGEYSDATYRDCRKYFENIKLDIRRVLN